MTPRAASGSASEKRPGFGISRYRHWLTYRIGGGFGHRWLPDFAQRAIVAAWNRVACLIWGCDRALANVHTDPKRVCCVHCCRRLTQTAEERGYAIQNERDWALARRPERAGMGGSEA